jgi:hypothetical protein
MCSRKNSPQPLDREVNVDKLNWQQFCFMFDPIMGLWRGLRVEVYLIVCGMSTLVTLVKFTTSSFIIQGRKLGNCVHMTTFSYDEQNVGISLSFCLLFGFGDYVLSMVLWSLSVAECHLHIIFMDLLWRASNTKLGSNVNK